MRQMSIGAFAGCGASLVSVFLRLVIGVTGVTRCVYVKRGVREAYMQDVSERSDDLADDASIPAHGFRV